jgi:hypothetical protein
MKLNQQSSYYLSKKLFGKELRKQLESDYAPLGF